MSFQPAFLDFKKGIRVGHLEPQERITRILKLRLEEATGETFNVDRFGRGSYWRWICFCPRRNRLVKTLSGSHNFCSAKYFISVEIEEELFKAGVQIERGFLSPPPRWETARLAGDWDWHRLLAGLRQPDFFAELSRLVGDEGFRLRTGSWLRSQSFGAENFPRSEELIEALEDVPGDEWSALQVYFPMTRNEVQSSSGADLVDAMMAIFSELAPVMNRAMEISIEFP